MVLEITLPISGYENTPVPNTFQRQEANTGHLAILFPGLGYTCDMPLLYYPTEYLLSAGADVLQVKYDYQSIWRTLSFQERFRRLQADALAAAGVALEQRAYKKITLIGKSLGTFAMGYLLESKILPYLPTCIFLTPLLQNEQRLSPIIRTCPRKLFVIGTADRAYNRKLLDEIIDTTQGEAIVIEDADHSLEFPGDPARSLNALQEVMQGVQKILS